MTQSVKKPNWTIPHVPPWPSQLRSWSELSLVSPYDPVRQETELNHPSCPPMTQSLSQLRNRTESSLVSPHDPVTESVKKPNWIIPRVPPMTQLVKELETVTVQESLLVCSMAAWARRRGLAFQWTSLAATLHLLCTRRWDSTHCRTPKRNNKSPAKIISGR